MKASTIRALLILVLVAAVGLSLPGATSLAQEVLTNDSVIQMIKAGLPEAVVIAKIRSTATKFDLKTDSLVSLKKAGVSDKVLEAMVAAGKQAQGAAMIAQCVRFWPAWFEIPPYREMRDLTGRRVYPRAPGLHTVGFMTPYTGFHHLLFKGISEPLIMTSANLPSEPMVRDNDEAFRRLASRRWYCGGDPDDPAVIKHVVECFGSLGTRQPSC